MLSEKKKKKKSDTGVHITKVRQKLGMVDEK